MRKQFQKTKLQRFTAHFLKHETETCLQSGLKYFLPLYPRDSYTFLLDRILECIEFLEKHEPKLLIYQLRVSIIPPDPPWFVDKRGRFQLFVPRTQQYIDIDDAINYLRRIYLEEQPCKNGLTTRPIGWSKRGD